MHWFFLTISSTFEVGWLLSLRATQGFTRVVPLIFYAIFGSGSAYFLSLAIRSVPLVTAYAVWIGGTMIGSTIVDYFYFKQTYHLHQIICMFLIGAGVVGLRVLSPH